MIAAGSTRTRQHISKSALLVIFLILFFHGQLSAQTDRVTVIKDDAGARLQVNGKDFMVFGMNWDYIPIGYNYSFDFWHQSEEMIVTALDREMSALQAMGVNAIRHYVGIPPRWVAYIYQKYGIYTVINHPLGRYGMTIDGTWHPVTNYSDPQVRQVLKDEMRAVVQEFDSVPGMLMWLLGNENNYGLEWKSAETEALPEGERQTAKARQLYSMFGEIVDLIKEMDSNRPVAIANGDIQYIDIIAEEVKGLDILGSNCYRGISARDLFQVVHDKTGLPVLFTEFGADAFNAKEMREDQAMQAKYLIGQWREIFEQSSGKGRVGNAIGGFVFQFSDGWWKFRQEENLAVHDINASWPNGGYAEDLVPGENNMNEEWWGICAKGYPDGSGLYELYPRAAYYALQRAFQLDPYAPTTTPEKIQSYFSAIQPAHMAQMARGDRAALQTDVLSRVRVKGVRAEFEAISTGGKLVNTPDDPGARSDSYPAFRGFDHMQSYYASIEGRPAENVSGTLTLNYLGHVAENPINEIYYENRGRAKSVLTSDGVLQMTDIERLKVYSASVSWVDNWFNLEGFYRAGHYHWGYEGDFFGLYREANYGENIDIYNGEAPSGIEITGKKALNGFKFAMGNELWWGANPTVMIKYRRQLGRFVTTGMWQEDLERQQSVTSSTAIPLPKTHKATLQLATNYRGLNIELGGIWSGDNKTGESFQVAQPTDTGLGLFIDRVAAADAFGGKFKLMYSWKRWNWYAQGAVMGLVADAGPTAVQTFTGWHLKDCGKGNQTNFLTGLSYLTGNFQIAPNFLYQKPIEGPIPTNVREFNSAGRPRNILQDPFAVRENREMAAGELLITYDPTPATWMYAWDSDYREDAKLAVSAGFIFRHLPTTMDAAIFIAEDGRTPFPFDSATPPRDLWEVHARIASKLGPGFGIIANLYGGTGEPAGGYTRKVKRYGAEMRIVRNAVKLITSAKFNDWGPYDYHRDFNVTFPLQLSADLSTSIGTPDWFDLPQTKLGIKTIWRTLDEFSSPRYLYAGMPGLEHGREWEVRTYLHFNVGM